MRKFRIDEESFLFWCLYIGAVAVISIFLYEKL